MIRRIALAAALALASTPLLATTYTLESNYTQGVFRWNHLGFSHPAAQFSQGQGTLEFDRADPIKSSVMVTIPLASMTTGVPDLDDDFRSTDFFDTAKFPTATFKSTKVEKGAMPDQLKVTGDLSLHGVTKPVTLDVTVVKIGANPRSNLPTVGFEATTTLKRSDFGLGKYVPQVSDEIRMQIISQAVDAKAYAEQQKAEAAKEAAAKDAVKK
jgi:polyisoprenoid-binding protein YceI